MKMTSAEPDALPDVDERDRQQCDVGSVSQRGPSIPTTSRPRLISPLIGCISRSNVMPTATVLTSTGKKMIERTLPLTMQLGGCAEHRQRHADHHLESAGHHGVDDRVAEALGQCRLPEELSEVVETDPLPVEQSPSRERVEQRDRRRGRRTSPRRPRPRECRTSSEIGAAEPEAAAPFHRRVRQWFPLCSRRCV